MTRPLQRSLAAVGVATGLLLAASPAHAVYNIIMAQSGSNVVITASGSINTAGVTLSGFSFSCGATGLIDPSSPSLCLGSASVGSVFNATTSPSNYGPGLGGQ